MTNITIFGFGNIGKTIVKFLSKDDRYFIKVVSLDYDPDFTWNDNISYVGVNIDADAARGSDIVICALPYEYTSKVAKIARDVGAHYIDLTEDVEEVRSVQRIAYGSDKYFLSQCGLAPGITSIIAHDMALKFSEVLDINIRVGALPISSNNELYYACNWSPEGIFNEYSNRANVVSYGDKITVPAKSSLEKLIIDGKKYEAFTTSGGIGSLCDTWESNAYNVNYKTIRYQGHLKAWEKMNFHSYSQVLNTSPPNKKDVVIIYVSVTGIKGGQTIQEDYTKIIYNDGIHTAIQLTTASAACSIVELLSDGLDKHLRHNRTGFIKQEDIFLDPVIHTSYGRLYR